MIDHTMLRGLFGGTKGVYGKVFITSDHHFGHENIIRFCNRPFANGQEMDAAMISRWNSAVAQNDVVIHLGDLTLGGVELAQSYLSQLNGNILFCTPFYHHDKRWLSLLPGYTANGRAVYYRDFTLLSGQLAGLEMDITLCHYPLASWERSFHGALHFHGHEHNTMPRIANRLDIGVDGHNFTPLLLTQAVKLAIDNPLVFRTM